MDKKLKKYIEAYETIQDCKTCSLIPNGGMIVLINQEISCVVVIENRSFELKSFQAILINAFEESIYIKSNENINLIAIRFKGAGASFFYEELMDELMQIPKEPIFIEKNIHENEINIYLKNRFKPARLPFNIMKIIDLLDSQGINYNIDEVLRIANVPRKVLDKMFRLHAGLTFKSYATIKESEKI